MSRTKSERDRQPSCVPQTTRKRPVDPWVRLSEALSHGNRLQPWRPEVDAAVQLAAEIALSERRKFRYNRN